MTAAAERGHCPGPPLSGGLTAVCHRYYDEPEPDTTPGFPAAARGLKTVRRRG